MSTYKTLFIGLIMGLFGAIAFLAVERLTAHILGGLTSAFIAVAGMVSVFALMETRKKHFEPEDHPSSTTHPENLP